MTSFIANFKNTFSIDNRGLIVARIVIGFTCLYDLLYKISILKYYIPNAGPFSKHFFDKTVNQSAFVDLNLFQFNSSENFFLLIIALGIIASLAIIAGRYVNTALVLNWLIFLSFKLQFNIKGRGFENLLLALLMIFLLFP